MKYRIKTDVILEFDLDVENELHLQGNINKAISTFLTNIREIDLSRKQIENISVGWMGEHEIENYYKK